MYDNRKDGETRARNAWWRYRETEKTAALALRFREKASYFERMKITGKKRDFRSERPRAQKAQNVAVRSNEVAQIRCG